MHPEVEKLNLEPDVAVKAEALKQATPGVVFLSGRRTFTEQAVAMAGNIVRIRDYIRRTYVPSIVSRRLQAWVDAHPEAKSVDAISHGLLSMMNEFAPVTVYPLSRHLTGRAFDIQPHTATVAEVLALEPRLFLAHEAGLEHWHVNW